MIILNHTLSFAPEIETESISWLKSTYLPLLEACPLTAETLFCQVFSDVKDSQTTYAIQIRFSTKEMYTEYCDKYREPFAQAMFIKLQNHFGIFSTTLETI